MPDWSYQTLFRPWLFRLPAPVARDVTLSLIGGLARLPGGYRLIEWFGHMHPPTGLACELNGVTLITPIGLSGRLDQDLIATPALAKFGFGFVEVGPMTLEPVIGDAPVGRVEERAGLSFSYRPINAGAHIALERLQKRVATPLVIRLAAQPGATVSEAIAQCQQLLSLFTPWAAVIVLDVTHELVHGTWAVTEWRNFLVAIQASVPLWACLPTEVAPETRSRLLDAVPQANVMGILVEGSVRLDDQRRLFGPETCDAVADSVRAVREKCGRSMTVVASGGVHQPADAQRLLSAGADGLLLDSGLVYAGPGLPKRINEALAYHLPCRPLSQSGWLPAWMWTAFLGWGMVLGGLLAWWIAATVVVLPYDEAYVGLTRAQLAAINPHLLAFMTHDRITLAGTMLSIGILYLALVWNGVRHGDQWAARVINISAVFGFASFFLFLGFGYFDPLHAFVSVVLLVFFLLGWRHPAQLPPRVPEPDWFNDRAWRLGLWGQFLFVVIAVGLIGAGATITGVGVTTVFVPEDLRFMGLTPETLNRVNERIIPLIAHDRAGFGGALVANGLAVLLATLWGFRRGARWLWWALLGAGAPGFITALGVHVAVHYLDGWHLLPGLVAVALYALALALMYPYLCQRRPPTPPQTNQSQSPVQ